MKRAFRIVITIIGIIAIALVLYKTIKVEEHASFKQATGFGDLEIVITANDGAIHKVVPFSDSEGSYCFFLPACAKERSVFFENLTYYVKLYIDGQRIKEKTSLPSEILTGKELSAELRFGADKTEACCLTFVFSDNEESFFFEAETDSVQAVDSGMKKSLSGEMTVLASDGTVRCSEDVVKFSVLNDDEPDEEFQEEETYSYKIKLVKDVSPIPEADASDEWVLMADSGKVPGIGFERVFSVAGLFEESIVPQGNWVDLYADGCYLGNYYFCEKTESIFKRLTLNGLNKEYKTLNNMFSSNKLRYRLNTDRTSRGLKANNPDDITGGYLIERVPESLLTNKSSFFVTDSGIIYEVIYPKKASFEMVEYLRTYFNEMEAAVSSEDGVNHETGKKIGDYLDLDSWADKYLTEEMFSEDNFHIDCSYLYKFPDETDSHIYFGLYKAYDVYGAEQSGFCALYADELLKRPEVKELIAKKRNVIDKESTVDKRSDE